MHFERSPTFTTNLSIFGYSQAIICVHHIELNQFKHKAWFMKHTVGNILSLAGVMCYNLWKVNTTGTSLGIPKENMYTNSRPLSMHEGMPEVCWFLNPENGLSLLAKKPLM